MRIAPDLHLTYCTNIHAGNGLSAVMQNLKCYGSTLKNVLSPNVPFGIGLRLSGAESMQLTIPENLHTLQSLLKNLGLYVFTMNGFPYGLFHDQPVKDAVHAPDWRNPERFAYTLRLAHILTALLPGGMDGGISTSPLSYKPWFSPLTPDIWHVFVHHLARITTELAKIYDQTGKHIHIDIEPEPDGLLENSRELVAFFHDWLLPLGSKILAQTLGTGSNDSEALLRKHIQVCWDTCHVAVAYETPRKVLARYHAHNIRVGKIQISSAIRVLLNTNRENLTAILTPFQEPVYLHQVIQRNQDGTLTSYPDLDQALPHIYDVNAREWRIHFHVPIFIDNFGCLQSTRSSIQETLALLKPVPFTHHLEIETYTWKVLPPHLKKPLVDSVQREFEWTLATLATTDTYSPKKARA